MTYKNKKLCFAKDVKEITSYAVKNFIEIVNKVDFTSGGKFTIALSGGKTPIPFYQMLNEQNLPWEKIHIFLVDERFVPLTHQDSNYRLIKEILTNARHIYPIPTEGMVLDEAADKYEQSLTSFFQLEKNKLPRFNLIILGIGEDGHTASLFPNDPSLSEKSRFTVAVKNETVNHERISITFPVINNAENIFFLANGRNKADILGRVLENEEGDLPAAKVSPQKGNLFFFSDQGITL